jgi:hypothetical protein
MVTAVKKLSVILLACLVTIICSSNKKHPQHKTTTGKVIFHFINTVKNTPLVLDSAEYTNPFGEAYRVSKLKYYISNITLNNQQHGFAEPNSYHLLDAADLTSLRIGINATANSYNSISFIVGVDSIKNVSGAQTDALDPANGMFWTWNSGYVMFKLEGNSPASNIINHRIEYHIGGFSGPDNVLQLITLPLSEPVNVQPGKECDIYINADINKLWQGVNDVKIATTPATMAPGMLSKKIADNYNRMFTIKEVHNH